MSALLGPSNYDEGYTVRLSSIYSISQVVFSYKSFLAFQEAIENQSEVFLE